MPLDPANLTPTASLNRMPILALPGLQLEPAIRGKVAYDLLSADSLCASVLEAASSLALSPAELAAPWDIPLALERSLGSANADVRLAAEAVTKRYGRHLGALLVVLRRGDPASRAARPDWDGSYWAHWSRVRRLYLGGGLASGLLGRRIAFYAAAVVEEAGVDDLVLSVAPNPALLPLIGAARSLPLAGPAALVVDFGQTRVKRGLARYSAGILTSLEALTPVVSPFAGDARRSLDPPRFAEAVAAILAEALVEARARSLDLSPAVVVSVASYISNNNPVARQGGPYAQLSSFSENLGAWLSRRISAPAMPLEVTLAHDCTAAARVFAGVPDAAVLMLGTAIGAGFPPPNVPGPLSPDFAVVERGS